MKHTYRLEPKEMEQMKEEFITESNFNPLFEAFKVTSNIVERTCDIYQIDEDYVKNHLRKVALENNLTIRELSTMLSFLNESIKRGDNNPKFEVAVYDVLVMTGVYFNNVKV